MDYRGDPSSALLEVLDPEQNSTFSDHYIELPFDLSKVLFIATANRTDTIPAAAARPHGDHRAARLHRAREGAHRARVPCCRASSPSTASRRDAVALSDEVLLRIDRGLHARGRRAQPRAPDRVAGAQVRARGSPRARARRAIEPDELAKLLGPAQFTQRGRGAQRPRPGVATGMVWTPVGGDIVFVEAARMEGKPELHLTGQMGDVMRESAEAALSYVRTNAEALRHRARRLREDADPRARARGRHAEGRPVGGRHDDRLAREPAHRASRCAATSR